MEEEGSLINRMRRVEHFKRLSTQDIVTIVRSGEFMRVPAGTMLFQEDTPCYGLCVLLRGEVHLYKLGEEGQENIIAVIQPVIMFNEVAAIDCQTNPVTAIAHKKSLVWRVDCKSFHEGLERFPKLGLGLLPVLARRNRKLIQKYSDLSFRPVRERLAIFLLKKSERGTVTIRREENSIQQLAAHIAASPVVVSRILGELRDSGFVESNRREIVVLHPELLARMVSLDLEQSELKSSRD